MGGFLFWLAILVCVVALVLLFFPFRFKIEFEAGELGCRALFFFFSKKLWTGEKQWGKKKKDAGDDASGKDRADYLDGDSSDKDVDDAASESAEPEFVATAPVKPVEKMAAPVESITPAENATPAKDVSAEKAVVEDVPAEDVPTKDVPTVPVTKDVPATKEAPAVEAPKTETPKVEPPKASEPRTPESEPEPEPEKKEKPKLTDEQFWTIILTPDLDSRAFGYLKRLLSITVRLFNIKFVDCFVEGIRGEYQNMGYGAALNGIFKSFPYLQAWDFRMDWCRDRELRAQGEIRARTNLCRVFYLLLVTLVYAGILFLLFWRRRARVLKTGELPELGFIRKKIVGWMVEE